MSVRVLLCLLVLAASLAPSTPQAMRIVFRSAVGEIVEGFSFTLDATPGVEGWTFCEPPGPIGGRSEWGWSLRGNVITIETLGEQGGCNGYHLEMPVIEGLPAGSYAVRVTLSGPQGLVEVGEAALEILHREGRCERDPTTTPGIWASLQPGDKHARVQALMADSDLARVAEGPVVARADERYGGVWIAVPPLRDVVPVIHHLKSAYAWSPPSPIGPSRENVTRAPRVCIAGVPDTYATVIEFANATTGAYFYSHDEAEVAILDRASDGPWTRTGHSFAVIARPACPFPHGQGAVYRFWSGPDAGAQSHFFTRDRNECRSVDIGKRWVYEGVAYWAEALQHDGSCLPGSDGRARVPLHRLWRPFGPSLHRLTMDPAVIESMTAQGWIHEGPRMCVQAQAPA